jgi:BirA family biotin operon repressor/biotin-[acetyl-CoA-carboxylase] ligase
MHIDPTARAAGMRHIAFDTIGSTNAEALTRARAGERGPLWITAAHQTAGRGRRGNSWVPSPGNLFATLLLSELPRMEIAPQLSFVAALAVHDAIVRCTPHLDALTTLKWPNDVLIAAKKVAGLLIEGESGPTNSVAIGIGANCASHPLDTSYPATDLGAEGARTTAATLFSTLTATMVERLAQWRARDGFAGTRADWLARAAGLGKPIRVRLTDRELAGRFHGLDEAGRLLLAQDGGAIETIAAGEVFSLGAGVEH